MWKDILNGIKAAASSYRRLGQAEDDVVKIQERANKHESNLNRNETILRSVLHEFEKVRMQMESDKQIGDRDREILLLRLDAALKNDTRALLSGFINQNTPELQAQIDGLKEECAELKSQLAALIASVQELKAAQKKANTAPK